jgi:hypothetical protein
MSHCISALINGNEEFITAGSSFRTINAVAQSGFDIYDLFDAYDSNNGMSGDASSHEIDLETATIAYKHAVAWMQALAQSFPERYHATLNDLNELKEEILGILAQHAFDHEEITALVTEKKADQSSMADDQIKRAFNLFYSILPFTYNLYKYVQQGGKAILNFI